MAELKIATKAFCNTLKSGSFSGDTTQCPTRSVIEGVGLTVTGDFESNQLVPEDSISYKVWEYTFSVTPTSYTIPAGGGSKQFVVTSYKIQYSTSTAGSHIEVPGSKQDVGYSSSNSTTSSGITWTASNNTLTGANNTSTSSKSGTITWTQNESSKKATANYTQTAGSKSYGNITITSATVSDIPAAGGSISTGNVSFSQTWGWNGATSGGGTLTGNTSTPNGATIGWSPTVSAASKGTTQSGRTSTGKTITVTVTWNGKSANKAVTVYQAENKITGSSTSWNDWVYTVNVSANPTRIAYSGGTSAITASGSGSRSGTITHTWSSGSKSTEPTSDSTSGNPTLSTNLGSLSSTTSPSTLTLPVNNGAQRTATITATWNSVSKTTTVTQAAGITGWNYYVTISPNSKQSVANTGGEKAFTISCYKIKTINGEEQSGTKTNCAWTATLSNTTGFSFKGGVSSGTGDGSITVSVGENTGALRTSTLTVKNSENTSTTTSVVIEQAGGSITYEYVFSINPSSIATFPAGGGDKSVVVTSYRNTIKNGVNQQDKVNVPYTASISGTGFSIKSGQSGNNGGTITVSASENINTSTRSGTLTISNGGHSTNLNVPLSQDAATYAFQIRKTDSDPWGSNVSFTYPAEIEGTGIYYDLKLRSSRNGTTLVDYSVSSNVSWIKVTDGNQTMSWEITSDNTSLSDRSGTITLTQETSGLKCYIYITQKARTEEWRYTLTVSPLTLTIKSGKDAPVIINSIKEFLVNGHVTERSNVPWSYEIIGDEDGEFSFYDGENPPVVLSSGNPGNHSATLRIKQSESNKTADIMLKSTGEAVSYGCTIRYTWRDDANIYDLYFPMSIRVVECNSETGKPLEGTKYDRTFQIEHNAGDYEIYLDLYPDFIGETESLNLLVTGTCTIDDSTISLSFSPDVWTNVNSFGDNLYAGYVYSPM